MTLQELRDAVDLLIKERGPSTHVKIHEYLDSGGMGYTGEFLHATLISYDMSETSRYVGQDLEENAIFLSLKGDHNHPDNSDWERKVLRSRLEDRTTPMRRV